MDVVELQDNRIAAEEATDNMTQKRLEIGSGQGVDAVERRTITKLNSKVGMFHPPPFTLILRSREGLSKCS